MITNNEPVLFDEHKYIFVRPSPNYKVTIPVITLLTQDEYLNHRFPNLFREISQLDLPLLNELFPKL